MVIVATMVILLISMVTMTAMKISWVPGLPWRYFSFHSNDKDDLVALVTMAAIRILATMEIFWFPQQAWGFFGFHDNRGDTSVERFMNFGCYGNHGDVWLPLMETGKCILKLQIFLVAQTLHHFSPSIIFMSPTENHTMPRY